MVTRTTFSPGRPDERLVVGVDAGGTVTRAVVATLSGRPVGRACAAGSNPNVHGPERAAEELASAVAGALGQAGARERGAVAACTVGLAGASALADPRVRARLEEALARVGLPPERCVFTGDDEAAFAAGTPAADGTVLVAGTGAIASRIEGRRRVRSADGMGWLIGDEGSAFWIGHQAARETARQLSRGTALSPLARLVAKQIIPGQRPAEGSDRRPEEHARAFARTLAAGPPIELARLAPLVTQAFHQGDPACTVIVDAAAGHLAHSVHQVRSRGDRLPVVMAGGVLLGSEPVRAALTRKLALGAAGAPVLTAGSTAGGAAWLAALRTGACPDDTELHSALTEPEPGGRTDAA